MMEGIDSGKNDLSNIVEEITTVTDESSGRIMKDGHLHTETYFHTGDYQLVNHPLVNGYQKCNYLVVNIIVFGTRVHRTIWTSCIQWK